MKSSVFGHAFLVGSMSFGFAIAACGGEGPGPHLPTPTPAATTPAGTAPSEMPASPAGRMKEPSASAMAEDLRKLGIDPLHPPPLSTLAPDVIRKLMPTFSRSLGVKCVGCHDPNNFKASTPNKRVAAGMWQHFVVELALSDGAPLYCDSCHGGKMEFLDSHDKKALGAWMDANYVTKLKRVDKQDNRCASCHGEPFDGEFLKAWQAPKK